MQPPSQVFPVLSFLGVAAQLGGAVALLGLFLMLRRFVLRRGYFSAWASAWASLAVAIAALVVRYFLVPDIVGRDMPESHPAVRALYFIYQLSKGLGFAYFVRGTLMYVGGGKVGASTTRNLWIVGLLFAVISTLASHHGLNEMVVWQTVIAVPALGYCASAFLWLPRARRTAGTLATGICFALLAVLWLVYAGAFAAAVRAVGSLFVLSTSFVVAYNSYFDLTLNFILGYSMVLLFMEDARREFDDAQAELAVTHDRLRRAALYDALTDSLNRHAYAEGVGLEMVRATFGTAVLADLDNLKQVNDRFGHAAGDQLLRLCAESLRSALRPYDRLYRWGGDEFLVIVPSARASEVLQRLEQAIESTAPVDFGEPVRLQVSCGAADFSSFGELQSAIDRADRAMYQEKTRRKGDLHVTSGLDPRTPTSAPAVR